MTDLTHLRLFVRIAERLSVTRAAGDLGVPQPTATRWLRQLEDAYGQKLLRRSTRQISLTDAGAQFLDYAREALERDAALRQALGATGQGWQGRLSIGTPSAFGIAMVLPVVSAFQRQNPDLVVDLRLADRYIDIIGEGADLAVRIGRQDDSRLLAARLANLGEVIACHPDLAAGIDPDDPRQVERLPWVRLLALRDGPEVSLSRGGAKERLAIRPRLWIDSVTALRQALLTGAGASLIHHYAIAANLARGDLVQLLPDWRLPNWPVFAVTPAGRRDPRVTAFIRQLKRHLAEALR